MRDEHAGKTRTTHRRNRRPPQQADPAGRPSRSSKTQLLRQLGDKLSSTPLNVGLELGRRLKEFRLEALRASFRFAWATKDYQTIIDIAAKVPDAALQEDEKLLTL